LSRGGDEIENENEREEGRGTYVREVGRLTPEQDFSAEGSATAAERRRVSERRRILDFRRGKALEYERGVVIGT
jgi:hypothetical protein